MYYFHKRITGHKYSFQYTIIEIRHVVNGRGALKNKNST